MNATLLQQIVEEHAAAVVAGHVEKFTRDLDPSLHERIPAVAALLPQPLRSFEIVGLSSTGDTGTSQTRYVGGSGSVTIRASWQRRGDRFVVVDAAPVG
ncbi:MULTISPECIES: hypothetical protein [unclassified Amycolatopsis]|uniref:hypothetical protein n=1 Tax=unclassified Amycolatopsis TaxID=2618356 RepID=UPI00031C4E6A|nr:hypothetical protein [Amycolatopsis sp. ATCC 39116]